MKRIRSVVCGTVGVLGLLAMASCTDLTGTIYLDLTEGNYYTDKVLVEAAVMRCFEHSDDVTQRGDIWKLRELIVDHFVWAQEDRHGYDDGIRIRLHEHKWDYIQTQINGGWVQSHQYISQVNIVLCNFNTLDFSSIGVTDEEKAAYFSDLRVLQAWHYVFLLDFFREVPIVTEQQGTKEIVAQSPAKDAFNFIESELKDALPSLPKEKRIGRWMQGPATDLLVRLYLNAGVWAGEDRMTDCKKYAQDIIDGVCGSYSINQSDYRDSFRSSINSYQSPGNLFELWHERGHLEQQTMWADRMRYSTAQTIGSDGGSNNGIHLQPSRDFQGNIYQFASGLGNPFEKYAKCDYRVIPFHTTGANGGYGSFFLQGMQMQYDKSKQYGFTDQYVNGFEEYVDVPLVFIGQVGRFSEQAELKRKDGESDETYKARFITYMKEVAERSYSICNDADVIAEKSQVTTGEENSGIRFNKFPYLLDHDGLFRSQSTPEMRLTGIYHSLAECYYREGNKAKAVELLDCVCIKNYPIEEWSKHSCVANPAKLADTEFLDERGREFLGKHRRRVGLIRWSKFDGTWWNKEEDPSDKEYTYFPIPQSQSNASPVLKQTTPGWEQIKFSIER